MLYFRSIILLTVVFLSSSCEVLQVPAATAARSDISNLVSMGDDIFVAAKKIESAGYSITGPKFMTAKKDTYTLGIDYGLDPPKSKIFLYSVGLNYPSPKNYGVIHSYKDGVINTIRL